MGFQKTVSSDGDLIHRGPYSNERVHIATALKENCLGAGHKRKRRETGGRGTAKDQLWAMICPAATSTELLKFDWSVVI